jgi:hypothetical protein
MFCSPTSSIRGIPCTLIFDYRVCYFTIGTADHEADHGRRPQYVRFARIATATRKYIFSNHTRSPCVIPPETIVCKPHLKFLQVYFPHYNSSIDARTCSSTWPDQIGTTYSPLFRPTTHIRSPFPVSSARNRRHFSERDVTCSCVGSSFGDKIERYPSHGSHKRPRSCHAFSHRCTGFSHRALSYCARSRTWWTV